MDEESSPASFSGLVESPDSSFDAVPLMYVGLRTERYTYIEFDTGRGHIYDLKNDPYQLDNFASTADPDLLAELHQWLEALKACAGESCRAIEANPP